MAIVTNSKRFLGGKTGSCIILHNNYLLMKKLLIQMHCIVEQ